MSANRQAWPSLSSAPFVTLVCSLLFLPSGWCAQPQPKAGAKARVRASAGAGGGDAEGFLVKSGFRVELVATEPLVASPVALAFDERGRLFVAEMRDYPDHRDESPHWGRIRVLEDMDEEGKFQTGTVYADDLPWPSAVACYGGGMFVAAMPDILYFKDTQGNGIADVRKVVYSGFGSRTNPPDARVLLHDFNWGLDNRIHCGTAGCGGMVRIVGGLPNSELSLGNHDFAFDPGALLLWVEAGPSQSGLSIDTRGRRFLSDFTRPLCMPISEPHYMARNPYFPAPPEVIDVASPSTAIYRFPGNATEPRTNAPAPDWLTMARGSVVYRGSAFPAGYIDTVFIADPEAHVIHHAVLRERGLEAAAERPADERQTEFLASKDNAFRPMQIINGPDGCLYIADMRQGGETGRIYRIVPEGFNRPKPPRLNQLSTFDLVTLFAQPNGWHQDTAARLLCERRDPASVALLTNMFNNSRLPLTRLRALHTLASLDALTEPLVLRGLKDPDERVREHAVLLCEGFIRMPRVSRPLWEQLLTLAADPSIRVRYQLAFTLGEASLPGKEEALAAILQRDLDNQWICAAVLSSLGESGGRFLAGLLGDMRFRNNPAANQFLTQLATMVGTKGRMDELTPVLAYVDRLPLEPQPPFTLLTALNEGLRHTGSSLGLIDRQGRLQRFFDAALIAASNESAPVPMRVEAVRLLGSSPYDYTNSADWLRVLFTPAEPPPLQFAAIAALGRCRDPQVAATVIQSWPVMTPALRSEAMAALMARNDRIPILLAALENRRIAAADIPSTWLNLLRTHRDPAINEPARKLLGPVSLQRPAAVDRFLPALRLTGVASRGRDVFLARCVACHRLGGEGQRFGPDLAGAKLLGKEDVFVSILEPNRNVAKNYATCVLATKEGENVIGIKTSENAAAVTLRQPGGNALVWAMTDLAFIETHTWSLMPEGLEQGLSTQDMADLLEYIMRTPR